MEKDFIVAIELGSSKVTGIAGQKQPDGSISVLAIVKEPSTTFIRKGVVYNIDKTSQCLQDIIKRLEAQLATRITQVFVGVGGQSLRSVRNTISRQLPADTIISQNMVTELVDEDWNVNYDDYKILEVAEQEYRVDTQLQLDPIGIRASKLEGNFLNILQRVSFFQNLNHCFEQANINVADMYLAPLALADAVLTETERRSGCVLVDIGAGTTTVSVYSKNVLRHLAVIPLGSANVSKDLESLAIDEHDAEQMKLKYASAFTENNDIDTTLKYSVNPDHQVESRNFIEVVEARMEEIIENVRYQIPSEYYDKLHGGIIITGGGAMMKDIDKAFSIHTHIEKVRVAKTVNFTVNTRTPELQNSMNSATLNTALALLAKGNINCAGKPINNTLFPEGTDEEETPQKPERKPRSKTEADPGVILTQQEEQKAAEEARRKKEEEERLAREAEEERLRQEAEERRRNSRWNKLKRGAHNFWNNIVSAPDE